jgi:RNA polymerase sigma-70 factor (ECF subfamily)
VSWIETTTAAETEQVRDDPIDAAAPEPREARLRRVLEEQLDFAGRTLRVYGVSEADVDDGVQQVCLVLADRLEDIAPGSEHGFVFSTAHHVASHIRRTRRRRREVPEEEAEGVEMAFDLEEMADARRALDVLSGILDSLDENVRDVFVLHEVEQLTMAAIAELLEIPPGTVASRLRRAREQFQMQVRRLALREAGAP